MARKRKPKVDKKSTVDHNDRIPTVLKKEVTKFNIEFVPIIINPETGHFENLNLFQELLPSLEEYSSIFGDDFSPNLENYSEWLKTYIDFVRDIAPWICVVVVGGIAQGLMWAYNWEGTGYSCEIGGFAKRGTNSEVTRQTIKKMISFIFKGSQVYVVRGDCAYSNRSARWAMGRAGMSHPEIKRAWKLDKGQEVTGIIYSITRAEWEALSV